MSEPRRRRMAVAITGATGAVFGVRMLERLAALDVETHLVISQWGRRTIEHETHCSVEDVRAMADVVHPIGDQGATMSSGSYRLDGMVVAPCSVRTMAAIAHGLADNLITRTADVVLKERGKLLLMVREAPLNDIHLQNMLTVSRAGAIVFPPMPAFYLRPTSIDDLVDHIVNRALDQLGLEPDGVPRWDGRLDRRVDEPAQERAKGGGSPTLTDPPAESPAGFASGAPDAGHAGDAFSDTFEREPALPGVGSRIEDQDERDRA